MPGGWAVLCSPGTQEKCTLSASLFIALGSSDPFRTCSGIITSEYIIEYAENEKKVANPNPLKKEMLLTNIITEI